MSYTFGITPRPFGASAATRPFSAGSSIAVPAPMAIPGTPQGFAEDPVFGQQAQTGIGTDAYGLSGGTYGPNKGDPTQVGWGDTLGYAGGFLGGPIGSVAGTAIGTGLDTALANEALSAAGVNPMGLGQSLMAGVSAFANSLTSGMIGSPITSAYYNQMQDVGANPGLAADVAALGMSAGLSQQDALDSFGALGGNAVASRGVDAGTYGGLSLGGFDAGSGGYGGGFGDTSSPDGGIGSGGMGAGGGYGDQGYGNGGGWGADGGYSGDSGGYGTGDSGWATGGYTGDGAPWEPAGTVHRGEVVLNAPATDYYGADVLEALNSQAVPRNALRALMRGR